MAAFPGRGWTDAEKGPSWIGVLCLLNVFEASYVEFALRLHQDDGPFVAAKGGPVATQQCLCDDTKLSHLPAIHDVEQAENVNDESRAKAAEQQASSLGQDVWKEKQKEQKAFRSSVLSWIRSGSPLSDCGSVARAQNLAASYMSRIIKRT